MQTRAPSQQAVIIGGQAAGGATTRQILPQNLIATTANTASPARIIRPAQQPQQTRMVSVSQFCLTNRVSNGCATVSVSKWYEIVPVLGSRKMQSTVSLIFFLLLDRKCIVQSLSDQFFEVVSFRQLRIFKWQAFLPNWVSITYSVLSLY